MNNWRENGVGQEGWFQIAAIIVILLAIIGIIIGLWGSTQVQTLRSRAFDVITPARPDKSGVGDTNGTGKQDFVGSKIYLAVFDTNGYDKIGEAGSVSAGSRVTVGVQGEDFKYEVGKFRIYLCNSDLDRVTESPRFKPCVKDSDVLPLINSASSVKYGSSFDLNLDSQNELPQENNPFYFILTYQEQKVTSVLVNISRKKLD